MATDAEIEKSFDVLLRAHRKIEAAWYADYRQRCREHLAAAIAKSPYRVVHETR